MHCFQSLFSLLVFFVSCGLLPSIPSMPLPNRLAGHSLTVCRGAKSADVVHKGLICHASLHEADQTHKAFKCRTQAHFPPKKSGAESCKNRGFCSNRSCTNWLSPVTECCFVSFFQSRQTDCMWPGSERGCLPYLCLTLIETGTSLATISHHRQLDVLVGQVGVR